MSLYFKLIQGLHKCSIPGINYVALALRIRMQCYSSQMLAPVVGLGRLGFKKCGRPCFNQFALKQCQMSSDAERRCNLDYEDICQLKEKGNIILIDIREPLELQEVGKLPDSINIPLKELESVLQVLSDKEFELKYGIRKPTVDSQIIFSCAAGIRSKVALDAAIKMGYTKACHYQGGFTDWAKKCKKN